MKFPFQFIEVNEAEAPVGATKEQREITEILSAVIDPKPSPAARVGDLADALRTNMPRVVHFIGHGNRFNELMFLNAKGEPYGADKKAIQEIFRMHRGNMRLVVLNACHTGEQARLIHEHVESVIGVNRPIDDSVAQTFATHLYRVLRNGVEVRAAFDEALEVVKAGGLLEEDRPTLWSRAAGRRAIIFPVLSNTLTDHRERRKESFARTCGRYGVRMESFTLTKENSEFDGVSTLRYEVQGLQVTDDNSMDAMVVRLETAAGLVHDPVLDKRAKKLVYWDPVKTPRPETFEGVIHEARTINGFLRFREKLRAGKGPYSFGWTVMVHNMDAFTKWEFQNLYPLENARKHVDGSPLEPPAEYIARLVWIPAERLTLRLRLPPGLPEASFRCFEWVGKTIDKKDVVDGGTIRSAPPEGLTSLEQAQLWEARPQIEEIESELLYVEADGYSTIEIHYPLMGSFYSLDWEVGEEVLAGERHRLASEASSIRGRLVEHRRTRLGSRSTTWTGEIVRLAQNLHHYLRQLFPQCVDEIFQSTIFSLDDGTCGVVACESITGDGDPVDSKALNFSLPFGMGLAGACFRAGAGIFTYDRGLYPRNDKPELYLPYPGAKPHAYLVALPIDHPDFNENTGKMERSRQLAGVLTVGSTETDSGLRRLCVKPQDNAEFESWKGQLEAFRNDCQTQFDDLSRFLLGRAGARG